MKLLCRCARNRPKQIPQNNGIDNDFEFLFIYLFKRRYLFFLFSHSFIRSSSSPVWCFPFNKIAPFRYRLKTEAYLLIVSASNDADADNVYKHTQYTFACARAK